MENVLKGEPWFWGRVGIFVAPWFLEFDVTNMVVTTMLVWARLPNISLHFWHHQVMLSIDNFQDMCKYRPNKRYA